MPDSSLPKALFIKLGVAVVCLWLATWVLLVIYTVLLQREELKAQREEQKKDEVFRRTQTDAMTLNIESLREQIQMLRQAADPAIAWNSATTQGPGQLSYIFWNKGGRMKITRIQVLDNNRVQSSFEPQTFIGTSEKGAVSFKWNEEQESALNVRFELHYRTTYGDEFKRFKITNGTLPFDH